MIASAMIKLRRSTEATPRTEIWKGFRRSAIECVVTFSLVQACADISPVHFAVLMSAFSFSSSAPVSQRS